MPRRISWPIIPECPLEQDRPAAPDAHASHDNPTARPAPQDAREGSILGSPSPCAAPPSSSTPAHDPAFPPAVRAHKAGHGQSRCGTRAAGDGEPQFPCPAIPPGRSFCPCFLDFWPGKGRGWRPRPSSARSGGGDRKCRPTLFQSSRPPHRPTRAHPRLAALRAADAAEGLGTPCSCAHPDAHQGLNTSPPATRRLSWLRDSPASAGFCAVRRPRPESSSMADTVWAGPLRDAMSRPSPRALARDEARRLAPPSGWRAGAVLGFDRLAATRSRSRGPAPDSAPKRHGPAPPCATPLDRPPG